MNSTTVLPAAPIRRWIRPVRRFLQIEAASGVLLLIAAALAMWFANGPMAEAYHAFLHQEFSIGFEHGPALKMSLFHWINDGLMTLFFFVVGLEIKREVVAGELRERRKAALPLAAAVGGMLVPALIYIAMRYGRPGEHGWGVPMATDIAFVVGVLALLGSRVPFGLKIMMLSLAIVDDLGAILVIAGFYSGDLNGGMLLAAGGLLVLTYLMNRVGIRSVPVYVIVGSVVWLCTWKSGIHPTIAGVALGLMTPATAWISPDRLRVVIGESLAHLDDSHNNETKQALGLTSMAARESISPLERLEHMLHPWVSFIIMPIFALANAGVVIHSERLADPIALAVVAGLLLGKPLGILGASWLAVWLGFAELPKGVNWRILAAGGILGGIGFTMSLFVANLGLAGTELEAAKVGVMLGSLAAGIVGALVLRQAMKTSPQSLTVKP